MPRAQPRQARAARPRLVSPLFQTRPYAQAILEVNPDAFSPDAWRRFAALEKDALPQLEPGRRRARSPT